MCFIGYAKKGVYMNPTIQKTTVAVNNWSKGLKAGGYRIPKNTVSYDIIKGVSPKRGEFIIYQFKNELGKVLKSCYEYLQKGIKSAMIRNYSYKLINKDVLGVRETKYINDKETEFSGKLYLPKKSKGVMRVLEEKQTQTGFLHTLKYLKPGEKPKGIKYLYKGYSPYFGCTSFGTNQNIMGIKNTHLLPVVISGLCSSKNTDEVIKTISNYEQSALGIKGFLNPIERCSLKELNPGVDFSQKEKERIAKGEKNIDKETLCGGGYDPFTKDISIDKNITNLEILMHVIAHETQHAKDACMIACLEDFNPAEIKGFVSCKKKDVTDFMEHARSKFGIIKKTDPRYNEYKEMYEALKTYHTDVKDNSEAWEKNPIESKAIPYGMDSYKKVVTLLNDLDKRFIE